MEIRALVFDFGNVVGYFSHHRATERLCAYSPLSQDVLHSRIFGGKLEDDYESGRLTTVQLLQIVRRECALDCDDEFVRGALADIFWPNEEMCALIPRLKGRYRLVLGSNTNELHADHFTREFAGTLAHFDHLVLSHRVGHRKPKLEFFAHCRSLAGCKAGACVFIDDLPANIAGARAAGMHGIVYRDHLEFLGELARLGVEV